MGTSIRFIRKQYSNKINKSLGVLAPTISAASLAVSTANLATNRSRNKKEVEFRDRQLKTTDRLINSLNRVDKTLKEHNEEKEKEKDKGYRLNNLIPSFMKYK